MEKWSNGVTTHYESLMIINLFHLISPIEREVVKSADDAMNEHQYARHDWGNPGKNHGTKDKWDD